MACPKILHSHSLLCNLQRHLSFAFIGARSPKILAASFKSHVNIDSLYPNSNPDYLRKDRTHASHHQAPTATSDGKTREEFNGYIPVDQLEISASKSSGPGGQHVNKVNSKVEVRFHVNSASWIPDWVKPRLIEKEHGKITKDGYLVITSDMTRKQMLNQADCMNKLRNMIYAASVLPKEPTKEEVAIKEERMARAKAGILREKKSRSLLKKNRSAPQM